MYPKEYKFFLKDIISILSANIIDLKKKSMSADSREKEYITARLFTYREIISTLRAQIKVHGISEEEIGLHNITDII